MELNSDLDSTESCYLKSDENGLVATTKKVDRLVKGRGCTGYQAVPDTLSEKAGYQAGYRIYKKAEYLVKDWPGEKGIIN